MQVLGAKRYWSESISTGFKGAKKGENKRWPKQKKLKGDFAATLEKPRKRTGALEPIGEGHFGSLPLILYLFRHNSQTNQRNCFSHSEKTFEDGWSNFYIFCDGFFAVKTSLKRNHPFLPQKNCPFPEGIFLLLSSLLSDSRSGKRNIWLQLNASFPSFPF